MSGELEKIIPALSDAALLDMVESDPVFYLPEALALAHATIEARGGLTVIQARVSDASHKFCWSCRAERPPTARFCPECGSPLKLQPESDAPAVPTKDPESNAAATSTDPSSAAGDALPSPGIDVKPEAAPEISIASAESPPVEPPAAPVASPELELAEASTAMQGTATSNAEGSIEIVPQPEVLSSAPSAEPAPTEQPVAEAVAEKAKAPPEVVLPESPPNATTDAVPPPKDEAEPNQSPESAEPPPVESPAAVDAPTEPEIVETLTPVHGMPTSEAEGSPEIEAQPEVLSSAAAAEPAPTEQPVAEAVAEKTEAPFDVVLPDSLPNPTTDVLPQPKAEPEPFHSPESAAPLPLDPPAAVIASSTEPESVATLTSVQGTPPSDVAVAPAQVAQPDSLPAVAAELPVPEAAPVAKNISDVVSATVASSTNASAAAPESPPSVSPPSPTPDAPSAAVVPDVAQATDPTPEDILASVMAASGQTEPEPVAPIESILKAGAEATIAAVVLDAQLASPAEPPASEGASGQAETGIATPEVVPVSSSDGSNRSKESPTDAVPVETKEAASPVRTGPKLATPSRRQTKPKMVRALAAGGVLAALVVAGMLALPYWPGRSMSRPAVAVHARARLTEPFQSALERCKSEYDASAGAVRRELTESIGLHGRETGGSLSVRVIRLRGKHGGGIARAREALREAETALATIGASPGFPASVAADFDKFSQIIARNERFFSATAPEAGFDQWYNDHPRMQAIYGRLQKAAARFDAEQSTSPSAPPKRLRPRRRDER